MIDYFLIVDKAGRIMKVRSIAPNSEQINAVTYISNLRKSWYTCDRLMQNKNITEEQLGKLFYDALGELFGNYDDIIILEDQ